MSDDKKNEHELHRFLSFHRNVYKCTDRFANIVIRLDVELRACKWDRREAATTARIAHYPATTYMLGS